MAEDAAAGDISLARRPHVRDATAIAEAVRDRSVSAVEVTREHLERAAADQLGAVWLITEARALDEAAEMLDEQRLPAEALPPNAEPSETPSPQAAETPLAESAD